MSHQGPMRYSVRFFQGRNDVNSSDGSEQPQSGCTCIRLQISHEIDQSTHGRLVSKDALAEFSLLGESYSGRIVASDVGNELLQELHSLPGVIEVGICAYEVLICFSPLTLGAPNAVATKVAFILRDFCCPSDIEPERQIVSWQESSVYIQNKNGVPEKFTLSQLLRLSEKVGVAGQNLYSRLDALRSLSDQFSDSLMAGKEDSKYELTVSRSGLQDLADCVKFTRSRVLLDAITRRFAPDKNED